MSAAAPSPMQPFPLTMEAARPADDARRALEMADPRMQAAMHRLKEARGITLDGDEGPVRDQVAFYQASVLLARVDAADPLRGGASPWMLMADQSHLLSEVNDLIEAGADAADVVSLVRAFDLAMSRRNG